jgi:hypothetical protein
MDERYDEPLDVSALITLVEPTVNPAGQQAADAAALLAAQAEADARRWESVLGWLGGILAGMVESAGEFQ